MAIIEHSYKPRPRTMLLVILFFGAAAAVMANEALTNDRGMILNGIIRFSPRGATIFYWCIAGLAAAFVVTALAMLVVGLTSTARVRLTATELSAPRSALFARNNTVVPLARIQAVDVYAINGQRFLTISHPDGQLSIAQSCLPNAAAFEELYEALRGAGRSAA